MKKTKEIKAIYKEVKSVGFWGIKETNYIDCFVIGESCINYYGKIIPTYLVLLPVDGSKSFTKNEVTQDKIIFYI